MTLLQFIRANRAELDWRIGLRAGRAIRLNNDERERWIMNDESLYLWAQSLGLRDHA